MAYVNQSDDESNLQTEKKQIEKKFDTEHIQWEEMYHLDDYASKGFQWRQKNGVDLCQEFVSKGGSILDVGCGTGHASFVLATMGYQVLGVDISSQMIEQAQKNVEGFPELDCAFIATDYLNSSNEERKFDGIIALGFIEYFDNPIEVLKKMGDNLNPNGIVIVQIWNKTPLAERLFDFLSTSFLKFRYPLRTVKSVLKLFLPKSIVNRYAKINPDVAVDQHIIVNHLRYSPDEFEQIALQVGYTVVGSRASRFFPTQFFLSEGNRTKIDYKLQEIAEKNIKLRKKAINYTFALMKD